jgi:DHA3 family macrolide efflux protein-like MFS transporter
MDGTMPPQPNWKKNTALFLGSQAVSMFGSMLVQYAILWYITLSTESGVMMMISIICGFLPSFLLSPFAGVWADRYNRKLLIALADAGIAAATLILVLLFSAGYDALWLLFAVSAVRAAGSGIQTPAVGALLPQIVPEDRLTAVNGTFGSLNALIMLVAPIVSAALLSFASIEVIFLVDVVTAAVAIAILLTRVAVPDRRGEAPREPGGYFEDMKQGLRFINHHAFLKPYFAFFALAFLLMAPAAFLTPLQVTRTFGGEYWRLTAIEITFSIGMMAGGALIASWGGFRNRTHTLMLACVSFGLCTVGLGVVPSFWVYLAVMGLAGVSAPLLNTPAQVMLQEKVDSAYMGRVFGVFGMISTSMLPIGMLIFGPAADIVPIERLLIGSGALFSLMALWLAGSRALREAGKPADEAGRDAAE